MEWKDKPQKQLDWGVIVSTEDHDKYRAGRWLKATDIPEQETAATCLPSQNYDWSATRAKKIT